jgi:putative integral membrane protein (TIGR02587 family)
MDTQSTVDQAPARPRAGAPGAAAERGANRRFGVALARAFGGAILFSFPLLMTMEMWWLGFYIDRLRLTLLLVVAVPLLIGLSYHAGFEETFHWQDTVLDAFVAYAVGGLAAALMLVLFAVITPGMSMDEIIGKVSLQAVPGSIGALLARSQLGGPKAQERAERPGARYGGELFLMAVGALFLAFNVAPTEEMVLIAYQMTVGHTVALALGSLLLMHAFVYALEFQGQVVIPPTTPAWSIFLRFTVVGYALALLISGYVLWTFGRTDGLSGTEVVRTAVVLGFPAALGAAAARLIL